ncbi:MAG: D-alanyl-D-alanine carboxypeptidase, partial [Candidatus Eremiobacteraeota bacterium]|nr:D-alanyl-D-alanine carboxypeptidase [Candidatus Eremiobacteraeota bacterium]
LPVSGVRGTLKSAYQGTPAEKTVFAKTGSFLHVSTISGFIRTRRHGAVTFSFMVDDWLDDAPALAKIRANVLSRFVTD